MDGLRPVSKRHHGRACQVLAGACSALPNGGGQDSMRLVRVLVPPAFLPLTRRLVDSCISMEARVAGVGAGGAGRGGLPYMLDVAGLNVELVRLTLAQCELDRIHML